MKIEDLIDNLKENSVENAFVLAYFYNKVCVGFYENGKIEFNENVDYNLLTQIRVFNEKLEIRYVLNDETGMFNHAIIEDDNENEDYFDEYMLVADDDNKRLIVRNYFEEEKNNHQIVISKSRLVKFTTNPGGEQIEN